MKVKEIVRKARGGYSQAAFSRKLGKSQAVISKYERGLANPPADILDRCLRIIEKEDGKYAISTDELIDKIRRRLNGSGSSSIRHALSIIVDNN